MKREDLRNIAIIAHVDHGKTTLVDKMLKQSGTFRENQVVEDRVMDSNDLERERGITILAKNTSCQYKDVKINIVDTPGHADFGGEVERVLKMVNGVILLVDASEGPMPQTRFVLEHALALNHKVIVCINKIDRPDRRIDEVVDEVLELLMDLGASDEQLDSPILYCSSRQGIVLADYNDEGEDMSLLFEKIIEYIDPPEGNPEDDLQILVSSIDYNEYVGRIAVGRIEHGEIRQNQEVTVCDYHDNTVNYKAKITALYQIDGLERTPVESAKAGDIVSFSGIENVNIGNTVCALNVPAPLPFVKISEPTVEMTFSVNDSPFAGREGKYVTSRQVRDRLFRELLKDVSLRVEETDSTEQFRVMGRGEMHLSILIENMRREGYEFQVSTPKVLFKHVDGKVLEPYEELVIDVPEETMGSVMESMGLRKGELRAMQPVGNRVKMEFIIPSRGLFGYRNEFMTNTRGEGIMNSVFYNYGEYKGEVEQRSTGSLVAFETGESVTYGLFNAQERGTLFIGPGEQVYAGMVVGYSPKNEDLTVNVCKKKQMTNTRASGSDEALRLTPPRKMSLEEAIEFMNDDELLEVTPENFRIRKRLLDHAERMRALKRSKTGNIN
ncbi:MAG: translational GTPase TypA [Firmicutes bacterium]|nr:translational GTPase TypA [Bacillota bacterium]MBQ4093000.1 translational GTPase TypA [Bacillota bacterium]